jgi:hypothetical protein
MTASQQQPAPQSPESRVIGCYNGLRQQQQAMTPDWQPAAAVIEALSFAVNELVRQLIEKYPSPLEPPLALRLVVLLQLDALLDQASQSHIAVDHLE